MSCHCGKLIIFFLLIFQTSKQGPSRTTGSGGADILKQALSALPTTTYQSSTLTSTTSHPMSSNFVLAESPDSRASPRLLHHPIPQRLSQPLAANAQHTLSTAQPVTVLQKSRTGDGSKESSVPAAVQSLFDSASKVQTYQQKQAKPDPGPENAEFLAMFNSLKVRL